MNRIIVGHQKPGEFPFLFENVSQKKRIFAAEESVDRIVSAHHCRDMSIFYCRFEGRQINFAKSSFMKEDLHIRAIFFLVITDIMFGAGPYPLSLNPHHKRSNQLRSSSRILAAHV